MVKSIPGERLKPYQFWDEAIKLFPAGVSRKRLSTRTGSTSAPPSPRGAITTFSRHSSLRLRRALVELAPADRTQYSQLGLTITVPWDVSGYDDELIASDYKIAFNRFSVAFRRRFPHSLCIFRHELQKRRAPHTHFVFWLSAFDFALKPCGRSSNFADLRALILGMWSAAVLGTDSSSCFVYPVRRLRGFHRFGIKLDLLNDDLAVFRYLADHASKHKKSQLGYKGKQWGFINRKLFVSQESVDLSFKDQNQYICFFRHLSKVSRYKLDPGKPSARLSKRSNNKSVIFVPDTLSRPLVYSVFSGRVCLASDLVYFAFVDQFFDLLRLLLELCYIQYWFPLYLSRLCSRAFVIVALQTHILIYS